MVARLADLTADLKVAPLAELMVASSVVMMVQMASKSAESLVVLWVAMLVAEWVDLSVVMMAVMLAATLVALLL